MNELIISATTQKEVMPLVEAIIIGGFNAVEAVYAPHMAAVISDFAHHPLIVEGFIGTSHVFLKVANVTHENIGDLLDVLGFFTSQTQVSTTTSSFKIFRKITSP